MTMRGLVTGVVTRTTVAVRSTLRHRRARAIVVGSTLLYLTGYLYAIGKLRFGGGDFGVVVAEQPLQQLFRQTFGTFTYEPVVLLDAGVVTYQLSLNTLIGLAIATLVGINVGVSYLAYSQPSACGIGSQSAGLFAGIPALLSGAACCAPVVVLLLGIQVTGAVLLVFELLLPIAVALLLGTLVVVARQVDPTLAG
ncbi:MAG: hypothetical protein PPP58_09110 [Natronomonas sp.]